MKDRPILFSAPMVRALLDGTKRQTRRVVKPQPTHFNPAGVPRLAKPEGPSAIITCPYGQPGDRLWVREKFNPWRFPGTGNVQIEYAADGAKEVRAVPLGKPYLLPDDDEALGGDQNPRRFIRCKGRPSMFMPRWASRITLEIVSVRVERLQDISEADAIAEGIARQADGVGWKRGPISGDIPNTATRTAFPKLAYQSLWESINGPGSWAANPWVWVIEFKRVEAL